MKSNVNRFEVDTSALSVYSGYLNNKDDLRTVASGGVATALSEMFIQNGGVVFGVVYTPDFKSAEFLCATTFDDIEKLKSSKYIVPEKSCLVNGERISVYTAVERKLSEGKLVFEQNYE